MEKDIESLKKLREPFPQEQIGKLAKGSKAQTQCKQEEKKKCAICGGLHHPQMIHLDFVGHAALTDRLLDVDPLWFWEPFALDGRGLPAFDESGGLWIKLTICGMTRIGYGHAESSQYKEIGSREKEVIGDALRNAAMRFGAALELWHKGDLHKIEEDEKPEDNPKNKPAPKKETGKDRPKKSLEAYTNSVQATGNLATYEVWWKDNCRNAEADLSPEDFETLKAFCKVHGNKLKKGNRFQCPIRGSGLTTTSECLNEGCPEADQCGPYQEALEKAL